MTKTKTIFSHPTGNQNVRSVVEALQREDILQQFYTSVAVFEGDLYDRLAKIKPFSDLRKRKFEQSLKPYTKKYPYKEFIRTFAIKAGLPQWVASEDNQYSIDTIYRFLDEKVAQKIRSQKSSSMRSVYAYEDGALHSFRAARKKGIIALYDLPIGYWRTARKLLGEELQKQPEWANTLTGFQDSEQKLQRKDEELQLADHIFVASQFSANSLKDYPSELAPIHIIPYGFPEVGAARVYNFHTTKRPLKLLFVGGLSQRKGIAYLLEAVKKLGEKVTLTIVGRKATEDCAVLNEALSKHHWIPSLSHPDILKLMRTQDVLVFPSLFEGFGLVITEAMSQGTPVITTNRTAGPDLITNNVDGWLIEAGSTLALQEKIEKLLARPATIAEVGKAAMERARQRPWEVYGKEIADTIRTILSQR
ncbi:MAG: glycosyltransferase family 4 protein [Bacteroidota bacterium]